MKPYGLILVLIGMAMIAVSGYWFPIPEEGDNPTAESNHDFSPRGLSSSELRTVLKLQGDIETKAGRSFSEFRPNTVVSFIKGGKQYLRVECDVGEGDSFNVLLELTPDSSTVLLARRNRDKERDAVLSQLVTGDGEDINHVLAPPRDPTEIEREMVSELKEIIEEKMSTKYTSFHLTLVQFHTGKGEDTLRAWIEVDDDNQRLYASIITPHDGAPYLQSVKAIRTADFLKLFRHVPSQKMKLGGTSGGRYLTSEERELVLSLKSNIEELTTKDLTVFTPTEIKTQVVAGINYFVKIKIGSDDECLHVRIYKPLGGEKATVSGVKVMGIDDPLTYFSPFSSA